MRRLASSLLFLAGCFATQALADGSAARDYRTAITGQWSVDRVQAWHKRQPWLVGCNYYPATAINQIEMWQASTFDPERIDLELEWAARFGMNTLRVYLHDLVWDDDAAGLFRRMDRFLDICQRHGIRPFFVFFDDCHFPNPALGEQPLPIAGYHNSGWVNSPARAVAERYSRGQATEAEATRLKGYVQGTMRRFADDDRVLLWELYNEPGRGHAEAGVDSNDASRDEFGDRSRRLVYDSWVWAREAAPSQPITSTTVGSVGEENIAINRLNSDVHSVHCYGPATSLRAIVEDYKREGRPVIVTEWLARTRGSRVEDSLPVMKELGVGAVNWGFVSGKTGTVWPWASRSGRNRIEERAAGNVVRPGEPFPEPELWFHDLVRYDGTPYSESEFATFRELTGAGDG